MKYRVQAIETHRVEYEVVADSCRHARNKVMTGSTNGVTEVCSLHVGKPDKITSVQLVESEFVDVPVTITATLRIPAVHDDSECGFDLLAASDICYLLMQQMERIDEGRTWVAMDYDFDRSKVRYADIDDEDDEL